VIVAPFGDSAFEIVADDARHARRIARAVEKVAGVREAVVGWNRVVAHVERMDVDLSTALSSLPDDAEVVGRSHLIRVVYDGPDLDDFGISRDELIALHSGVEYEVEVIGFLPGFAYLGGVDRRIALPRRKTPRPRVPALSIGIADQRTAIYPSASPGGWNLIGRAIDVVPFDPEREPPSLFAVGDRVRFTPC
jgi:KipI family sensor histidine kinase inhibitor